MDALDSLTNYIDPDTTGYEPLTPADLIEVTAATDTGCWQTWTGTHYPTFASVPWQAQGSATLVECDGTVPSHQ